MICLLSVPTLLRPKNNKKQGCISINKMDSSSNSKALQAAKDLWKVVKGSSEPFLDVDRCETILNELSSSLESAPRHKVDIFQKTFAAASKSFRLQKRNAVDETEAKKWGILIQDLATMTAKLEKKSTEKDETGTNPVEDAGQAGPPETVTQYLSRLRRQGKELYKDPPVLPPTDIKVEPESVGLPQRSKNGRFTFPPGRDAEVNKLLKDFRPNRSPEEVLRGGAFGGTYFRSIVSAVTNQKYDAKEVIMDSVPEAWIKGMDAKKTLTSQKYDENVNKFKVKCGGSLGMWESSGWISDIDPYGWFQWYCRFFQGRRSSDDFRQIKRWLGVAGVKGRFKSQLCNKIINAGAKCNDMSISPVIRQTLWHWGLEITDDILESHKRR